MQGLIYVVILGIALVFASDPAQAQCGSFCLYENMSPDMGRSGAGAGARAQDSSTAFWNPAGMTELGDGTEVMFGLGAAFSQLNPDLSADTVTPTPPALSGSNAGGFAPLFGSFISTKLPYDVHVGMSVTPLYGGSADYNASWTGRTQVTDVELFSLLIQPSFAYAVTDWLSLGVGPTILYTVFDEQVKATNDALSPTIKVDNAEDWSAGAAVSALVKPIEGLRVGLTYRTELVANTKGDVDGPLGLNPTFDGKFTFPQGVNVSAFYQLCERWALLADAGWSQWHKFGQIPLSVGPLGATGDFNWHDTWRAAIGVQYAPTEMWTLQGGFGYDSSPVDASDLQPVLPSSQQFRFSAGVMFRPKDYVEIAASYTFNWFGDMRFNDSTLITAPLINTTVLDGKFSAAYANYVALSLKVKF